MTISDASSPYLSGHLAPVDDELDVADLRVTGTLPDGLVGSYLRNGPNPAFPPLGRYHIFDGDGMIHGVTLADGRAWYRNRWVESPGLLVERREGRALFGGLSEFRMPPPEVAAEVGIMKNTANTNIVSHGGRLLALLEAAKPIELSPELATVGEFDFGGRLQGPMTAHPKVDPVTGEMLFFGYTPFPPYLRFHVADASGALVRSVDVELPAPVMMHDFVITERYAVFFDLPAVFDLDAMLSGGAAVSWKPDNGARVGLLDRRAPDAPVRWIEVEPFWVFHFLNAYDTADGRVVVEGCRASRLNVAFGDEELGEAVQPTLHRWTIDAAAGAVATEQLDDHPADFPRIDDRLAGRRTRYGYLAHSRGWGEQDIEFNGVTRHDLFTGATTTHVYAGDAVCGEAVFAPDPGSDSEDAGWLLNYVLDRETGESSMVVLDAASMEETARVHLPRRVPFGFHGNWIARG